jgi:hypothetical protein
VSSGLCDGRSSIEESGCIICGAITTSYRFEKVVSSFAICALISFLDLDQLKQITIIDWTT